MAHRLGFWEKDDVQNMILGGVATPPRIQEATMGKSSQPPGPPDGGDRHGNDQELERRRCRERQRESRKTRSAKDKVGAKRRRCLEQRRVRYLWRSPYFHDGEDGIKRLTPFGFRQQDLAPAQLD
jgi:hypothetical protein